MNATVKQHYHYIARHYNPGRRGDSRHALNPAAAAAAEEAVQAAARRARCGTAAVVKIRPRADIATLMYQHQARPRSAGILHLRPQVQA